MTVLHIIEFLATASFVSTGLGAPDDTERAMSRRRRHYHFGEAMPDRMPTEERIAIIVAAIAARGFLARVLA